MLITGLDEPHPEPTETPIPTATPEPTPTLVPTPTRPHVNGYLLRVNGEHVGAGQMVIPVANGEVRVYPMPNIDGGYIRGKEVVLGAYPEASGYVIAWNGVDTGRDTIATVKMDRDRNVVVILTPGLALPVATPVRTATPLPTAILFLPTPTPTTVSTVEGQSTVIPYPTYTPYPTPTPVAMVEGQPTVTPYLTYTPYPTYTPVAPPAAIPTHTPVPTATVPVTGSQVAAPFGLPGDIGNWWR